MRSALLLAASLACFSCSSSAEPTPAVRDAPELPDAPEPPEPPEPPETHIASADGDLLSPAAGVRVPGNGGDTGDAKTGVLRESLGEAASVVESALDVKIARLRVIGALHAQIGRLQSEATIAGYPVEGAAQTLDQAARATIVDTLFDDASYQWGLARRCANDYLIGLRFTTPAAKVEFALGMPCEQAFFVFATGDEVTSIGHVATTAAAQRVVEVARAAGLP